MITFALTKELKSKIEESIGIGQRAQPAIPVKQHLNEISYHRLTANFQEIDLSEFGVSDATPIAIAVIKHGLQSENQAIRDAFKRFYWLAKLSISSDDEEFAEATTYMSQLERGNQQITEDNERRVKNYNDLVASQKQLRKHYLNDSITFWNETFLYECAGEMQAISKSKKKQTSVQKAIIEAFQEEFPEQTPDRKWWLKFDPEVFKVEIPNSDDYLYDSTKDELKIRSIVREIQSAIYYRFQELFDETALSLISNYQETCAFIMSKHVSLKRVERAYKNLEEENYRWVRHAYERNGKFYRVDDYNDHFGGGPSWFKTDLQELDDHFALIKREMYDEVSVLTKAVTAQARNHMHQFWPRDFPNLEDTEVLEPLSLQRVIDHIVFNPQDDQRI
jgi:hypothetical protein